MIGSVANYLARHDWQPGEPVLLPATIDADARDAALRKLDGGISERRTLAAWESDGVTADALASQFRPTPVGLLALEDPPADGAARATYWIACANFFVITRYNRSRLYASAVWSLVRGDPQGARRVTHALTARWTRRRRRTRRACGSRGRLRHGSIASR